MFLKNIVHGVGRLGNFGYRKKKYKERIKDTDGPRVSY